MNVQLVGCYSKGEKRLDDDTTGAGWSGRTFAFSQIGVFLLSRPRVLEPNLCDALTQARIGGNSLQILPVRIAVQFETPLQHLQLFLGECGSNAFYLLFQRIVATKVTVCCFETNGNDTEKSARSSKPLEGDLPSLEVVSPSTVSK